MGLRDCGAWPDFRVPGGSMMMGLLDSDGGRRGTCDLGAGWGWGWECEWYGGACG